MSATMTEYGKHRTFTLCVIASAALHAGVILAVLLLQSQVPGKPKTEKLLVELFGMIAHRQRGAATPPMASAEAQSLQPPPSPSPSPSPSPAPRRRSASLPRLVQAAPTSPGTREMVAQPMAPTPQAAEAAHAASSDAQIQTTIAAKATDADALKRYLVKLRKKLQENIVYPEEAKEKGYEGNPVLRFTITEDGTIRPGSLVIVQSSGYLVLDQSAIEAALASEPFDRPAHRMEAAVKLTFGPVNEPP